ncbi:ATP-binding cassette domain-containing protein [Thiorhodococcus mannitoliphagus]|uniref:ATP-binding cassette domain-containing protein n=1 Tax=Thiorhodococcus mannitoliphagus TaxID=329406 RepID=A0A6P1DU69_9GAMM|nr:ATP-binding cassette domain-containing protein [Thiorhodococcus mannitoliphagus]NEX19245.1 ATP-binding cassette domain-containing protein [Thiorhodococcus mannitoliphagus]
MQATPGAIADEPVLELSGVYQHVKGQMALSDIALSVPRGEWLLVTGPNGAGKTLLARLLLGLDRPSAGRIQLLGRALDGLEGDALKRLRADVGGVLQGGSLLESATVLDNLLLPLRDEPLSRSAMARAARLVMTLLNLDGLENQVPRALSLGQRRLVELARALIREPKILVWDGFSEGLDLPAMRETLGVLSNLSRNRGLTLVATDNRPDILGDEPHRIAVLARGRLLFTGTADELEDARDTNLALRAALAGTI